MIGLLDTASDVIHQCCLCGKFATVNGWRILECLDPLSIHLIVRIRLGLTDCCLSHGLCPACAEFYKKELEEILKNSKKSS